jgi:hypothetical protein
MPPTSWEAYTYAVTSVAVALTRRKHQDIGLAFVHTIRATPRPFWATTTMPRN